MAIKILLIKIWTHMGEYNLNVYQIIEILKIHEIKVQFEKLEKGQQANEDSKKEEWEQEYELKKCKMKRQDNLKIWKTDKIEKW